MSPSKWWKPSPRSGLRGRGGAGFPTGIKWKALPRRQSRPGDRALPHLQRRRRRSRRFHGPQLAGRQSAQRDRRHDHRRLRAGSAGRLMSTCAPSIRWRCEHLRAAIEQAEEYGPAGRQHPRHRHEASASTWCKGAGAFVCGEETALIASIEGRVGEPHPRPPYPARRACGASPRSSTTSKTWATVPVIINRGADWYAAHRHREEQGHDGLLAGRQDQQHRPGRSAHGDHAARDDLRHRRRHSRTARR